VDEGSGNRLTVCTQAFDVELDSFVDEYFDLFAGFTNGYAARKIRHVSPIAG